MSFEPLSNRLLLNDWMTVGVFLLGAISLSVPSGYSYATVILVLGSILMYWLKVATIPLLSCVGFNQRIDW